MKKVPKKRKENYEWEKDGRERKAKNGKRLSWVSSHSKNPKTSFVDGALVGARSLKHRKKREIYKARNFFPV